jgi:D-3-phosphoglycerate dehydrogenase
MRVLILAPFAEHILAELHDAGVETVHENWLDSGELQDPEQLGARLARENFGAVIVEADFLLPETFNAAPNLRFAGICRAAVNQVDVKAATEHGIVVVNTPGRNAGAVAEMTMALMLALSRRVAEADRYVRGRKWESPVAPYTALRGSELGGKVAGIIGLGAIGRRVAELCNAFGMNVLAFDPLVKPPQADRLKTTWAELDFLLEVADFVTLHAPPPANGTPLLNAARIARMKQGAVLINTASAELVAQDALAEALRSGRLAGAGLDIFPTHPVEPSYPLLDMPNVVLTPHIGGATEDTILRHSAAMTDDLLRFMRGEKPVNLVNPEVWERRRGV